MAAIKTEAAPYLDAFRPDAGEPSWLADARRAALTSFGERGFPTRREEPWRFTSLRPLADKFFPPQKSAPQPGASADVATALRQYGMAESGGAAHRIVFLNGRYSELHSRTGELPKGAWLASLPRAIAERPDLAKHAIAESDRAGGQPFASLNAALFADGFVLALDEGVVLDRPVEIVHIADSADAASLHLRHVIALAPRASATLVETYFGSGPYWTNTVTGVAVGEGATLTQVKLQDESRAAIHFGMARVTLAAGARYRNFGLALGANLSRQDLQVVLGDGADVIVAGAFLQRGDQDTTNAIVIDHAACNGTTRELFKGVLDERAHGAFLGTIRVREGAQKTDAKQTSRTLLLSDRAAIDTKPELEILADDVKCAHGATVGDLDKDTLFYLRARGIGAAEARRMLIEAFVLEVIETLEQPALRDHLARHVRAWLGQEAA
jgi:Fe-S cluster assembly protein SufD